jgi:hypothetical protein
VLGQLAPGAEAVDAIEDQTESRSPNIRLL